MKIWFLRKRLSKFSKENPFTQCKNEAKMGMLDVKFEIYDLGYSSDDELTGKNAYPASTTFPT